MKDIDKGLLIKMVDEGLVSVNKHPEEDLYIYNYTSKVQYDRLWNGITLQSRGLILDSNMDIVSRPFKKFFNLEEHEDNEIPKLPFDVYEKMDGSLGVMYWVGDKPYISTRGSFVSEQSIVANEILHSRYSHLFSKLNRGFTYLFEIIYPSNRIVVDYGGKSDLILLAVIDNKTGLDVSIEGGIGFPIVKRYDGINNLGELRNLEESNKEGFVVVFSNGFRVKVKFSEYVRLHRIITRISNIVIWEYLRSGKDFGELLDRVPDEFYEWVRGVEWDLRKSYREIYMENMYVFREFSTRKETALYFKEQKYPSILFSMLDDKTPDDLIWKMVRPKYSKPFIEGCE